MNNSPINFTINSTTVGELADATSLRVKFRTIFLYRELTFDLKNIGNR